MTEERPQTAASTPEPAPTTRLLERREQELSYVSEVAHALAAATDEQEVLGLVLDRVCMLLRPEVAAVANLAGEAGEMVLSAVRPAAVAARVAGRRYAHADGYVDRALREARPVQIRRGGTAASDPLLRELLDGRVPETGVIIPVRGRGGVELGGLIVLNTQEPVQPADLRFLFALADHAAVALCRARLVRIRSEDGIRLSVLSTILHAAGAGLDEAPLLGRAMEALLTPLPADYAEIVVRDGGELRTTYTHAPTDHSALDGGPRVQTLHLRTIERGEATVQGTSDPAAAAASRPYAVCVPLVARDRVLGSLLVMRGSHPYDERERDLLADVGRHLGVAAELSRLFRRAAVEADQLERVAAERSTALRTTKEQLARSQWLASLGEIAAGVAHDLNNALNPIVAFAELIKEHGDDPEKVRTYAERILLAAQGGAETVRRIQRFTRHRIGGLPFQALSVATLVRDAVELVRPTLAERGYPIEVFESVDPQLVLNGNPGELRQALLNLVTNALDAMPTGGVLRFVARSERDEVVIAVQDTGTGMPPEIRARALEPFFTTKGAHGTGLGLAEAFGIVRRHGGSLELESWPGTGTTILFRLPAAHVPAAAVQPRVRAVSRRAFRILLVDDNLLGLEATAASLRAAGHTVATAPDADTALKLFRPGEYDVVLSDLGLPDLNGLELLERLRRRDRNVRIGVITGWVVGENDEEMTRRGVEIVLSKPVDPDQLLSVL